MSKRANPTLIGAFVVGALALVVAAVIAFGGGGLFAQRESVLMYFRGSIYGLQLGAPVVFRGVRLGSVTGIDVAYDKGSEAFYIPVTAELDRRVIRDLAGADSGLGSTLTIEQLVQRGLRAQLSLQSLLTAQLYVDLDFEPSKPARRISQDPSVAEVPTISTAIQELRTQIEQLDVGKLADDVSEIARTARRLLAGPELEAASRDLRETLANLNRTSARIDAQIDPLAGSVRGTLRSADQALKSAERTMQRLDATAARFDDVGARIVALAAPDAPLLRSLQQATDELARSAAALRRTTGDDSTLQRNLNRTLHDVSQAARSLRELSDTLDRQPEALLRGRRDLQ